MRKKFIVVLSLFFAAPLIFAGPVSAGDDFNYWSAYDFTKVIDENHDIFYAPQIRFNDDAGDFFYHEHRLGVRFKQIENLGIGVHYLFGRTEPSKGPWKNENRAELDLTPKWKWGEYSLSVRGRAEYRHIEGSTGDPLEWRFRLQPKIAWKADLFGTTVTPYISNDAFYHAEKDEWDQNRLYLGVGFPLGEIHGAPTKLGVFYLFKSNRGAAGDWSSTSALGTKLSLKF